MTNGYLGVMIISLGSVFPTAQAAMHHPRLRFTGFWAVGRREAINKAISPKEEYRSTIGEVSP